MIPIATGIISESFYLQKNIQDLMIPALLNSKYIGANMYDRVASRAKPFYTPMNSLLSLLRKNISRIGILRWESRGHGMNKSTQIEDPHSLSLV